jgi:hypothetical protein
MASVTPAKKGKHRGSTTSRGVVVGPNRGTATLGFGPASITSFCTHCGSVIFSTPATRAPPYTGSARRSKDSSWLWVSTLVA